VCVEANVALEDLHGNTIRRNAPQADFSTVAAAISGANGLVGFTVSDDIIESRIGAHAAGAPEVPALRLSDVLMQFRISQFSLVCDIEGAESLLLDQDSGSLGQCKWIIIELHESPARSISQLAEQIEDLGFARVDSRGAVYVFARR
jgi:FkbM family methyltransferase